jgi:hypothetical protein
VGGFMIGLAGGLSGESWVWDVIICAGGS